MTLLRFAGQRKTEELHTGIEKRRYYRFPFELPLRFQSVDPESQNTIQMGKGKNVSQGGILFKAVNPISRKSLVLVDPDTKALSKLIKIDKELTVIDGRILGRVMRTHLNLNNGLFEIGVQFVKTNEREKKQVEEAVQEIGEKLKTGHRHHSHKRRFGIF